MNNAKSLKLILWAPLSRSLSCGLSLLLLAVVCSVPMSSVNAEETTAAASITPRATVEKTVNEVVRIVEKLPGEDNLEARRAELRKTINPVFDFDEMAKRSLGPHWTKCAPEERAEFVKLFSDLLAHTYMSRLENVERNMVRIVGERVRLPKAVVRTSVQDKGDEFPIDYKLVRTDNSWRVYDVVIENIGLVANYRNEFSGIIRKEQFSGLLERLRKKNAGEDTEATS